MTANRPNARSLSQLRQGKPPPANRRLALLLVLLLGLAAFFAWLPARSRSAWFEALRDHFEVVELLLVFSLLSLSLIWSAGERLDTWLFLRINLPVLRRGWLDHCMWWTTQLGSTLAAVLLVVLLRALGYSSLALEVVLGALTLSVVVETFKALTNRARPFLDHEEARVIGRRERGRSFPSGHTAQTFFVCTLLSQRLQPDLGGLLALGSIALLVGFSRIYVGAHYPRDVLGGALLGTVWGSMATVMEPSWFGW